MRAEPGTTAPTDPVRDVFRSAVRDVVVLVLAVTVVGTVVGGVVAGGPGVWGGLVGGVIALLFGVATPVTMLRTAESPLSTAMAAVVAGWLGKTFVLLVAVVMLRDSDALNHPVFFCVVAAGLLGSVVVDGRAVLRGRVPYVTPAPRPSADDAASPDDDDAAPAKGRSAT